MSNAKAADLVARMQRLGGSPAPTPPAAVEEAAPRTNGGRRRQDRQGAPVRLTVDLDPDLHRQLRLFALEERVDASEIIRVLIRMLGEPDIHQVIVDRLAT